jgi:hypothetical protein
MPLVPPSYRGFFGGSDNPRTPSNRHQENCSSGSSNSAHKKKKKRDQSSIGSENGSSMMTSSNRYRIREHVRFSPPTSAKELATLSSKSGYLLKQADNQPGVWNKYFFLIRPVTFLYYYNSKEDDTPRGILDMEYLTDIRYNKDCIQKSIGGSNHAFRVTGKLPVHQRQRKEKCKLRPLFLDIESKNQKEVEEWMEAFKKNRHDCELMKHLQNEIQHADETIDELDRTMKKVTSLALSTLQQSKEEKKKLAIFDDHKDREKEEENTLNVLEMLEKIRENLFQFTNEIRQKEKEISYLKAPSTNSKKKNEKKKKKEMENLVLEEQIQTIQRQEKTIRDLEMQLQNQNELEMRLRERDRMIDQQILKMEQLEIEMSKKESKIKELRTTIQQLKKSVPKTGEEQEVHNNDISGGDSVSSSTSTASSNSSRFGGAGMVAIKNHLNKFKSNMNEPVSKSPSSRFERLPRGWCKRESRQHPGEYYYINDITGESSWEKPQVFSNEEESESESQSLSEQESEEEEPYHSPPPSPLTVFTPNRLKTQNSDQDPPSVRHAMSGSSHGAFSPSNTTSSYSRPYRSHFSQHEEEEQPVSEDEEDQDDHEYQEDQGEEDEEGEVDEEDEEDEEDESEHEDPAVAKKKRGWSRPKLKTPKLNIPKGVPKRIPKGFSKGLTNMRRAFGKKKNNSHHEF